MLDYMLRIYHDHVRGALSLPTNRDWLVLITTNIPAVSEAKFGIPSALICPCTV